MIAAETLARRTTLQIAACELGIAVVRLGGRDRFAAQTAGELTAGEAVSSFGTAASDLED